jgi:hypothetical protein
MNGTYDQNKYYYIYAYSWDVVRHIKIFLLEVHSFCLYYNINIFESRKYFEQLQYLPCARLTN